MSHSDSLGQSAIATAKYCCGCGQLLVPVPVSVSVATFIDYDLLQKSYMQVILKANVVPNIITREIYVYFFFFLGDLLLLWPLIAVI